jgi:hypothetical protein
MAAKVRVLAQVQPVGSDVKETVIEITGDASYPTGGYPVGNAQGLPTLGTVLFAIIEPNVGAAASQTYDYQFDYANSKIKFSRDNGEVAAATNVSTIVARALIYSR